MSAYQRKRSQAKKAGTWQPYANTYRHQVCSVDGCEKAARYRDPYICNGHYQQAQRGVEFTPLQPKNFVTNGTKRCSRCGIVHSLDQYVKRGPHYAGECKACVSILNRSNRLGVSFDDMKALLDANPKCVICGSDGEGKPLHVDHCHDSGSIRGILCHYCNTTLMKRNTPELLRRMAAYLEGEPI